MTSKSVGADCVKERRSRSLARTPLRPRRVSSDRAENPGADAPPQGARRRLRCGGEAEAEHAALLQLEAHRTLVTREQQHRELRQQRLVADEGECGLRPISQRVETRRPRSRRLERSALLRLRPFGLSGQELGRFPGTQVGAREHGFDLDPQPAETAGCDPEALDPRRRERPTRIVGPALQIALLCNRVSDEVELHVKPFAG